MVFMISHNISKTQTPNSVTIHEDNIAINDIYYDLEVKYEKYCIALSSEMNKLHSQNLSFQEYGLAQSKKIAAKQHSHAGDDFSKFSLNAKKSLKDFENLDKNAGMDINKYVELYNSKI